MFSNQTNTGGAGLFGNKTSTGNVPTQPQGQGNNIFNNPSSGGGSIFSGNNPQPAQTNQTTNILAGGNQAKSTNNLFGGGGQTGQQPGANTVFGNTANTSTTPSGTNNLFGNTAQQNKPGGLNNQPAGNAPSGQNLFSQNATGSNNTGGLLGNANNIGNTSTNPTATQPQSSGQPPATGTGTNGSLFTNTANTGANILAQPPNNPPATTGNTGTTNPPAATTNFFANKPTETNNPPTSTSAQNPSTTGGGLFTNKPTTSTTGNLFTGGAQTGQTGPSIQTGQTTQTGQGGQTGGNLFTNQNVSQTGSSGQPATNVGQNSAGANIFSNQGGQTGTAPVSTGMTQPQDDIEAQFDRSNKTVAQFINECRSTFLNTYEDLQKMCDSTLKYLNERQQNQKIAKNFAALEPLISNKSEFVIRTLETMQKQQDEVERAIEMMSKRLGEGRYTHELSEHIQEYQVMKEEIMKLQEDAGEWSDPGNEQLMNIFQNLNQIETQIREMDQIADIYMNSLGFN